MFVLRNSWWTPEQVAEYCGMGSLVDTFRKEQSQPLPIHTVRGATPLRLFWHCLLVQWQRAWRDYARNQVTPRRMILKLAVAWHYLVWNAQNDEERHQLFCQFLHIPRSLGVAAATVMDVLDDWHELDDRNANTDRDPLWMLFCSLLHRGEI